MLFNVSNRPRCEILVFYPWAMQVVPYDKKIKLGGDGSLGRNGSDAKFGDYIKESSFYSMISVVFLGSIFV